MEGATPAPRHYHYYAAGSARVMSAHIVSQYSHTIHMHAGNLPRSSGIPTASTPSRPGTPTCRTIVVEDHIDHVMILRQNLPNFIDFICKPISVIITAALAIGIESQNIPA